MYKVFGKDNDLFVFGGLENERLSIMMPANHLDEGESLFDLNSASDLAEYLNSLLVMWFYSSVEKQPSLSDADLRLIRNGLVFESVKIEGKFLEYEQHAVHIGLCCLRISGTDVVDGFCSVELSIDGVVKLIQVLSEAFELVVSPYRVGCMIIKNKKSKYLLRIDDSVSVKYIDMGSEVRTVNDANKYASRLGYLSPIVHGEKY